MATLQECVRGMRCLSWLALAGLLSGSSWAADTPTFMPLKTWWSRHRSDYWLTGTDAGARAASQVFHYRFVRIEGCVLAKPQPGTAPLELFWNERLSDNRNVANPASKADAVASGYELKATEGYVYTRREPGAVPLKLFWSPTRTDSYTVATRAGEQAAHNQGYRFVRIEGFVRPAINGHCPPDSP